MYLIFLFADTDVNADKNLKTLSREFIFQMYRSNIFSFKNGQHNINAENLSNILSWIQVKQAKYLLKLINFLRYTSVTKYMNVSSKNGWHDRCNWFFVGLQMIKCILYTLHVIHYTVYIPFFFSLWKNYRNNYFLL